MGGLTQDLSSYAPPELIRNPDGRIISPTLIGFPPLSSSEEASPPQICLFLPSLPPDASPFLFPPPPLSTEAALRSLLGALTSEAYDDTTQHLEREQALAKQFAEILHFTLRFDELKVMHRPPPSLLPPKNQIAGAPELIFLAACSCSEPMISL